MKKLTFISCLLLSGCLAGAMAANKKQRSSPDHCTISIFTAAQNHVKYYAFIIDR